MNRTKRALRRVRRKAARCKEQNNKYSDCLNFDKVFSFDHLWESALKCMRGVKYKKSVQNFMLDLPRRVLMLYNELQACTYKPKRGQEFTIRERGKVRNITSVVFRDRVVERCFCDYCLWSLISSRLTHTNSASQSGKGTSFARDYFQKHMQAAYNMWGRDAYVVHYDIHNYFASIKPAIAYKQFETLFLRFDCDSSRILYVLRQFLFMAEGMLIGNEVSQLVGIFYLNEVDHLVRDKLHHNLSGRYMDDGYMFCKNKLVAKDVLATIDSSVSALGVNLNEKKSNVSSIKCNQVFLKDRFYIKDTGAYVCVCRKCISDVWRRFNRHYKGALRLRDRGVLTDTDLAASMVAFSARMQG